MKLKSETVQVLLFTKISSLLSPILQKKNLDILTGALAERILFDDSGTQALAVVFSHGGELNKIPLYNSGTQALAVVFSHGGELNKNSHL
jgi:hypothetical protein